MERIIVAVMAFMLVCGCIGSSPEESGCSDGEVFIDGVCCSDLDSDGVCDPAVTTVPGSGADSSKDLAVASEEDAVSTAKQSAYVSEALSDGTCSQFAWSNLKMVLHVEDWQLTSCSEGGRGLDFCSGFEYGMPAGDASNKAKLGELFGRDISDFYLIIYACSSDVNYLVYLDSETGDVKGEKISLWGSGSDPTTCEGFSQLGCMAESITVLIDEVEGDSGNLTSAQLNVSFENLAGDVVHNISVGSEGDCISGTESFSEDSLGSGETGAFTCMLSQLQTGESFTVDIAFSGVVGSNESMENLSDNGRVYGVIL